MANLSIAKMSSRGRIVIPEEIRKRLKLKTGTQFMVLGEGDVVILQVIVPPSIKEFDALLAEARRQASESGLKPADVTIAIAVARDQQ